MIGCHADLSNLRWSKSNFSSICVIDLIQAQLYGTRSNESYKSYLSSFPVTK